ncbi:MAG: helix-turn-helix transcriptional regulator [Candidatus Dormibacteraeota bacterium]|nr:helix-turn-helix transcriptional regulator [Candidatus Dormibacteraeota bacterium]MBV8445446.1 helix-turn-helix transcriptional regulator [Candidatus Dormibacteraeota bacterium]
MTDTTFDQRHDPRHLGIDRHELRNLIHEARRRHRHGGPFGRGGPGPWNRGHGFFGGAPFGGGRRAGRGDIRAAILALLNEEPMHGYQIIQELSQRTDGAWRASPGSVYPTLQQLEDEGLVKAVQQEGGRRVFELTDTGREEAKTSAATPPWEEVAGSVDDTMHSLRDIFVQVAAATWQVGSHGTVAQVTKAQEILRDARRGLYQLLAEDENTPKS